MKIADIQDLIHSFDQSSVSHMKLKLENLELTLDKNTKRVSSNPEPILSQPVPTQTPPTFIQTPTASACALSSTAGAASVSSGAKEQGDYILSPMVGTFYHRPSPNANPYVSVGDIIKKGQTIGIVEAMKIMNEIEAECDCKVLAIEVDDATAVEYGTQLVKIEKL
ncbi:acetyl-CoA carboxylase biotin carboxyl carrier protein [Helicobacter felis]|uniref:acetyl-CoA carboxylase biotin carboxyl carrier protein n=1 Tax=Helicobacter felis TaxID=214 RepID=UPI000CF02387|nr:acetyl-CoA carboxylase biotin carboxyl carrier protein [Helicobacter felis]